MSEPDEIAGLLKRFADRLRSEPEYMSSVLAQFKRAERLDDDGLAQRLSTTPEMLVRMALCKCPASESDRFAADVRRIAEYTGSDAGTLANLLRQVNALARLAKGTTLSPRVKSASRPGYLGSGALAAARDRTDTEEESLSSAPEHESTDDVGCAGSADDKDCD